MKNTEGGAIHRREVEGAEGEATPPAAADAAAPDPKKKKKKKKKNGKEADDDDDVRQQSSFPSLTPILMKFCQIFTCQNNRRRAKLANTFQNISKEFTGNTWHSGSLGRQSA